MKKSILLVCCLFLSSVSTVNCQNIEVLKTINSEIWTNFTKVFEELDYELFFNMHSNDLVRVSGDSKSIKGKSQYLENYKKYWKNDSINQTISFRFLERICNDEKASERGIYKLTRNPDTPKEKSFYGKFHVILKKEKDGWKILVDYDSSENETINETSYNEAFHIEDFKKY